MTKPTIDDELRDLADRLETDNVAGGVLCVQAACEIDRLRALLRQIGDVCRDNDPAACDAHLALKFIRSITNT